MRRIKKVVQDRFGYLYILSNPSLSEHQYKIGQTSKSPEIRAKALSGTAMPTPFSVEHFVAVKDRFLAEAMVFSLLSDARSESNREFFESTDINHLIRHIDYVAAQINALPVGGIITQASYEEEFFAA